MVHTPLGRVREPTSDGNSSGNDGGKGGKGKDKGGSKDPKEKEKTQGAPKP